jgi:hypothetical protein
MRDPVSRSARATSSLACDRVIEIVAAELIIGDFRTFFILTWTIPSCMLLDMKDGYATKDDDTFICLAAATARVTERLRQQTNDPVADARDDKWTHAEKENENPSREIAIPGKSVKARLKRR